MAEKVLPRTLLTGGCVIAVSLLLAAGLGAQDAVWVEKHPAHKPSARDSHAIAYDTARQEVVLFGGYTNAGDNNETWVWDGTDWTQRFPPTSPQPRSHHWMAYDTARGQVVLFGGAGPSGGPGGYLDDTWTWDGVTWTERSPSVSPSPRNPFQGMAYDAGRARVVLFGGVGPGPTGLGDTWTWDGTNWSQASPTVTPPSRGAHALAYDEDRGESVLFGGNPVSLASTSDTWTWDGTTWTQKTPATYPGARSDFAMAADGIRSQLIIFGGATTSGTFFDDTWAWDGVDWSLQPLSVHPSGRGDPAMAHDSARGQVVLFGGGSSAGPRLDDTWVWEGNNPVCDSARAVPSQLWPPNHKFTQVNIAGVSDPQGSSVSIAIDQVTQDEPVNGLGDGDTSPDAVIQGANVQVRAERSGTGNGRVYLIGFTANDGQGGTCSGTVSVSVPHSKKSPAHDDGQLYDSTLP